MTTYNGKSAFPEDHPLSIGCGGVALPRDPPAARRGPHLQRGREPRPHAWLLPDPRRQDDDPVHERRRRPLDGVPAHGRARRRCEARAATALRGRPPRARPSPAHAAEEIAAVRGSAAEEWAPKFRGTPDQPPAGRRRARCGPRPGRDDHHPRLRLPARSPGPVLRERPAEELPRLGQYDALGSSLGLALGAKVAAPEKIVVNLMGDAAFGQSGLDLETGVRNKIAILCVVINNSEMGNYEKMQPVAQERFGIKRLSGSYAEVAAALGALPAGWSSPRRSHRRCRRPSARCGGQDRGTRDHHEARTGWCSASEATGGFIPFIRSAYCGIQSLRRSFRGLAGPGQRVLALWP